MNWVDLVLIGTLVTGGLLGMQIGIIRASFAVIGVFAVILTLAQFRGGAESWLLGYLPNDAAAAFMSYAAVISATVAAIWLASNITRKLVYGMLMGWTDRLGGMAAGLVVGAVLAAAVILSVTGFLNTQKSLEEGIPGKILNHTPLNENDVSNLASKFTESSVASFLLSAADKIPDKTRDLAPLGWRDALENLEDRLEGIETAQG